LYAANIKPFIPDDLMTPPMSPMRYKMLSGGNALGIDGMLVPRICDVLLDAHKKGKLRQRQQYLVDTAEILMRGFARVGIIALIDEATGYQEVRDRLALQAILDQYLRKEFAKWAKQFPPDFSDASFQQASMCISGLCPMKVLHTQEVRAYTFRSVGICSAGEAFSQRLCDAPTPLLAGLRRV
jgi:hypothetical protein